jgi:spore coat protein U-like protein
MRLFWVALACVAGSAGVQAATTCLLGSKALAFGNYDPSSASPTDGNGSVMVNCTDDVGSSGISVALDIDASSNGPYNDRKMAHSGYLLSYGIYSDSTRSTLWGGSNVPTMATGTLVKDVATPVTFPLYGRIPPQQNVRAGHYTDAVVVSVSP